MPELPEVEIIKRGLDRALRGRKIIGFWTDWPKYFRPLSEAAFRRHVVGKKIIRVTRRAKNILVHLRGRGGKDYLLLVHQKMSGHLMVGKWLKAEGEKDYEKLPEAWRGQKWVPVLSRRSLVVSMAEPLADPKNRFIRAVFFLDDGKMLALSDLRRFAKMICGPKEKILALPELAKLGPEPLSRRFVYGKFLEVLDKQKRPIKQALMDPYVISGIGNIYADEILWVSKIHPQQRFEALTPKEKKILYKSIKFVLRRGLKYRGTSIDDYRDAQGKRGGYDLVRYVYQREGEHCLRCGANIRRIKIAGRSAHFCSKCQIFKKSNP